VGYTPETGERYSGFGDRVMEEDETVPHRACGHRAVAKDGSGRHVEYTTEKGWRYQGFGDRIREVDEKGDVNEKYRNGPSKD
jgi:hypothetical protein